jgi:hypothetical protein
MLCLSDEDVDVWKSLVLEPCLSHQEVAPIVEFLAQTAKSEKLWRSSYMMSLDYKHIGYFWAYPACTCLPEKKILRGFSRFP